jgi:Ca-activated chloride channel family protein
MPQQEEFVKNLIKKHPTDRFGLIAFGYSSDTDTIINFLNKIKIGIAGDDTALGTAVGNGVNAMKDLNSKSKTMIVFTDGNNNVGRLNPFDASTLAGYYILWE